MHIKEFYIDGFGIYHDLHLQSIPAGLSIFLGENEAGKTTCMEFLRTMLTGFGQGRNPKNYVPLRGGRFGGSLVLQLETGDELELARYKDKNTPSLALTRNQASVNTNYLSELLAGVSHETYTRVFGFSLSELERKLTSADVQDALYSATFGANLRDPATVLKNFSDVMAKKFTPRGKNAELNRMLLEFQEQSRSIEELSLENANYDALLERKESLSQDLAKIRNEKKELEKKRRLLERRLNAWQAFDEWRALEDKLSKFAPALANFPEQGAKRLEELSREERQLQNALLRQEKKYKNLMLEQEKLTPDLVLLAELPLLERLAEQKTRFREAEIRLQGQKESCVRIEKELNDTLHRLGDWSLTRLHETDLSLVAHNQLESTAIELRGGKSAFEAACLSRESASRDVSQAKEALALAEKSFSETPLPKESLSSAERDELRQNLARFEECARQIPEKKQNHATARTTFARAWNALQMESADVSDPAPLLDALLKEQEHVRGIAEKIAETKQDAKDADDLVLQIEARLKEALQRAQNIHDRLQEEAPSESVLDEEAHLVRRLRNALLDQKHESDELQDLEAELLNQEPPSATKNMPLLVLGGTLTACGVIMLSLNLFFTITSLSITDNLILPLDLWSAYFVLFAGVLGLWGGFPHDEEELKRRQGEFQRKEARLKKLQDRLSAQNQEINSLTEDLALEVCDDVSLESIETRIGRDRERIMQRQNLEHDLKVIQQEINKLESDKKELEEKAAVRKTACDDAVRAWEECLSDLGVQKVPDAARAQTFLTRVEMARMGFENMMQAERALKNLETECDNLMSAISSLDPVREALEKENEEDVSKEDRLLGVAQALLTGLRENDRIREEYSAAKNSVDTLQKDLARLEKKEEEANLAWKKAQDQLNSIQEQWETALTSLGLSSSLNPQTANEALHCIRDCLSLEHELKNAEDARNQTQETILRFQDELSHIIERTAYPENHLEDGSVDFVTSFEHILEAARHMEQLRRDAEQIGKRLLEEKTELDICEAEHAGAESAIQELLAQTDCADVDAFLQKAREQQDMLTCKTRKQTLESTLKIAAEKEDLQTFLQAFATEDQASQEQHVEEVKTRLNEIASEEESTSQALAQIEAKLTMLTQGDELSKLWQERSALQKSMEESALEWARYALAYDILQKTREAFEQERQPAVLKAASEIFQHITNGKWQRMVISLDKAKTVHMLPQKGNEPISPDALSRGTQEQAYLALRLAYILSHAEGAESLPLLMDEVLVNFDRERAHNTAHELAHIANGGHGKKHQIFYFTCHPEMVELFMKHDMNLSLFRVENGSIRRVEGV